jgi:hypothetical protein
LEAILKFNLPEDSEKFEQCIKASDMASVLFEFLRNTKKQLIKNTDVSEEYVKGVEDTYEKLYVLMEEFDINIDKLV